MLHPGRVVEHQSASSCRAGRCVVVRRTRCRVPSVESPVVTFCTAFLHKEKRKKNKKSKKAKKKKQQKKKRSKKKQKKKAKKHKAKKKSKSKSKKAKKQKRKRKMKSDAIIFFLTIAE